MTSILEQAQELIHGERQKDYGHPRDNITHTAQLFSAYLGIEVTPLDVSALMILLKLSRVHGTGYHRDSIIDIAGYAGVAERVHEEPVELDEPKPREWTRLEEVPEDVTVVDRGGHFWTFHPGFHDEWLWSSRGGKVHGLLFKVAPFTEVLEGT